MNFAEGGKDLPDIGIGQNKPKLGHMIRYIFGGNLSPIHQDKDFKVPAFEIGTGHPPPIKALILETMYLR